MYTPVSVIVTEDAVGISGVADPDLAAARSDRRHRLPVGRVLPALDEMKLISSPLARDLGKGS